MASNLLMNISQDERERAIFRSRRKFQMDHASDMATSRDNGITEGILIVARNMMADGESIEKTVRYTGLSHDVVEGLKDQR